MDTLNSLEQPLPNGIGNGQQISKGFVVGIGASAGGMEALEKFFKQVEPGSGITYVVNLHLSPDLNGQLVIFLQHATPLPVTQLKEPALIEPDHVYIVPPGQRLVMQKGIMTVIPLVTIEDRQGALDFFFHTLADVYGSQAFCVVLSGSSAHGARGLQRIKEQKGTVFVQSPVDARYNEMPRNAIATGLADEVLPADRIPARILLYKQNPAVYVPEDSSAIPADQQEALQEIFGQLRLLSGHDFSQYKRSTILRRIQRRIQAYTLSGLREYRDFVHKNSSELDALFKDLLISVTHFFRDQPAFDCLEEEIIPKLFHEKTAAEQVRIWVAGCATGEEAYSIAMLCAEQAAGNGETPKVQIFATDLDELALEKARSGLYTIHEAAAVSPERLQRFFQPEADGFRIRHEIRETILFARHSLLNDPPFFQIDLIACRNLLIYLDHSAQEKVLQLFHFALNPYGYLFLGSSESVGGDTFLFGTFSQQHRIYQAKPGKLRLPFGAGLTPSLRPFPVSGRPALPAKFVTGEDGTLQAMHLRLRNAFAPPSIMINQRYDILHVSDNAGRYLRFAGGESTLSLLQLVRDNLRFELRLALHTATTQQKEVCVKGLQVTIENKPETVNLRVRPDLQPREAAHGLILVVFEPGVSGEGEDASVSSNDPLVKRLEEENIRLSEQLRSSNEQHEIQGEELKATNEELQAMIEELRAASEELETGKEELQSTNEELRAVNQELKIKVDESTLASNNLQNLINSTNIGTIFLDRLFRVVLFTPAARGIFNLIPADYGRPVSDITNKLDYPHLLRDAEEVLKTLQVTEREVNTSDGQVFLMRVLPYVSTRGQVDGVVVTFVDILERAKESERKLRKINNRVVQALKATKAGWVDWDWLTGETAWSEDGIKIMGFAMEQEARNIDGWLGRIHPGDRQRVQQQIAQAAADGTGIDIEYRIVHPDGEIKYVRGTASIEFNGAGQPLRSAGLVIDITAHWKMLETQRRLETNYKVLFDSLDEGFCVIEVFFDEQDQPVDYRFIEVNAAFEKQTGISHAKGKRMQEIPLLHEENWFRLCASVALTGETMRFEHQTKHQHSTYDVYAFRTGEPQERRVAVLFNNISERKRLEQQKDDFISIASHELKTPLTSIKVYTEFLLEEFQRAADADSASLVQKLDTQIDRLTQLVHDMFDSMQISEGKLNLRPVRFDLDELIAEQVAALQLLTRKHRLIHHPCGHAWIRADRERIRQVLTNLVSNAIKYSPKGGDIVVRCAQDGEENIELSVRDAGIGIPAEQQEKIFDRFFRVSNKNTEIVPGIGLGLYITASIIHRHGGSIRVESKENKGSTFILTLPAEADKPAVP